MQTRIGQPCLATVALGLVVALTGTTFAQSSDPRLGTWKLNLAKSTYAAGTAPKSVTFTSEAAGAGIKSTVDVVAADGTVQHWVVTSNYDGKDNPLVGTNVQDETVARTRVDANTVRMIYKKAGKVTTTQISVVSKDGKTITITSTGTDAKGQTVKSVAVYDKQ
jgi:hypothetical protein